MRRPLIKPGVPKLINTPITLEEAKAIADEIAKKYKERYNIKKSA